MSFESLFIFFSSFIKFIKHNQRLMKLLPFFSPLERKSSVLEISIFSSDYGSCSFVVSSLYCVIFKYPSVLLYGVKLYIYECNELKVGGIGFTCAQRNDKNQKYCHKLINWMLVVPEHTFEAVTEVCDRNTPNTTTINRLVKHDLRSLASGFHILISWLTLHQNGYLFRVTMVTKYMKFSSYTKIL